MQISSLTARLLGVLFPYAMRQGVHALSCWRNTPCSSIQTAAFPGPWDSGIFAPASRTVTPFGLLDLSGRQLGNWTGSTALGISNSSVIVLDFGREVGGIVSIDYTVSSCAGNSAIGIAFSEAKNWIGSNSDSSTGTVAPTDGAIYANFSGFGDFSYVMPDENIRGGFRYMTLFLLEPDIASIRVNDVSMEIAFQPTWSSLQAYQGYFHSNDDLLNRIWYSGAYTLQTDAIHPSTGRSWPPPNDGGWIERGAIGPGHTIITDGAKRDRTVWPGDLGVAVPAAFYSTGDLESVKNGLQSMYDNQDPATGELPFSGPPLSATGSDTYHMWSMVGTYNYMLFSDDLDFLNENWASYVASMEFAMSKVNSSGQFYVDSSTADWGRLNANGSLTSAQAIFYRTLVTGASLADWVEDATGLKDKWLHQADKIRSLALSNNWDALAGAFFDAPERKNIHSQDGNSLAVLFGLVDATSNESTGISNYLVRNWVDIGAECEELPGTISPFISSFEIQSHLLNGQTQRALDLIRKSWGWYLNNPNGTQSTMVEGYLINGTFGYRWNAGYNNDFSYTSHSHGWSTGPVTALTEHILGLSIIGRAGSKWRLAPQPGDLKRVEGGFKTKLGKFSANWSVRNDGVFKLEYDTPKGTCGNVVLPLTMHQDARRVVLDGKPISQRGLWTNAEGSGGRKVFTLRGEGGKHSIVIE